MSSSTSAPSARRQHQFPTLSIRFLATYATKNALLPPESKSTITDSLPYLLNTCERIRASCWLVLSVIVDALYLRTRGIVNVNDEERSRINRFFLRFQTASADSASQKLAKRLELERRICDTSFESLNKLRDIALVEINKLEQLQGSSRFDSEVFDDVKYVNDVVKGFFERMEKRYRTPYDKKIVIGNGEQQVSYDAITATKDVVDFAERLRDGRVSDSKPERKYNTYKKRWSDFAIAVHETLGKSAKGFDEGGKARVLHEVSKLREWQGVNEFASWAVTHMAMLNVMAYGKVKSFYRVCYDYKVEGKREWVLPGWVVRYIGVLRKDDLSFKVTGEKYGVYLRQERGGVWNAKRIDWEGEGKAMQAGDYEGMWIQIDTEGLESVQQSACEQQ